MNSFGDVMRNLDWSVATDMLMSVIPALVCITLHEISHGYVAYKLGDNTAKNMGRLTLNPIKHIDIVGLIMMVVFKFGWAKPVPVDMRNFKHPKRDMAITALAGPVSNLLICCVVLFIYGIIFLPCKLSGSEFWGDVLDMVYITSYLSIALAIFNIIPVPPLDGSHLFNDLFLKKNLFVSRTIARYGMGIVMVLSLTGILGKGLGFVTGAAMNGMDALLTRIFFGA